MKKTPESKTIEQAIETKILHRLKVLELICDVGVMFSLSV